MKNLTPIIRIAIQRSGRISAKSIEFLRGLGLSFQLTDGKLNALCQNMPLEIVLVRCRDITFYVENNLVDLGIVGKNMIEENSSRVSIKKRLGFGECKLVLAAPKDSSIASSKDLKGKTIATSYPNSLKNFLKKNNIEASIVEINGSVEIAPKLNLADAICDLTQTGKTLTENGLRVIEEISSSEAVLIANARFCNLADLITKL